MNVSLSYDQRKERNEEIQKGKEDKKGGEGVAEAGGRDTKQSINPIFFPSLPPFPPPFSRYQQQALQGAMDHRISHQRHGRPKQVRELIVRRAGIETWLLPYLPRTLVTEEVDWGLAVVFLGELRRETHLFYLCPDNGGGCFGLEGEGGGAFDVLGGREGGRGAFVEREGR